jgi:hypothetical protein
MYALAAVLTATHSSGGSTALGFAIWITAIAAYWTPTAVAWFRHVPNAGSVTVINGFLGWTIVGWIVALAMACRSQHPQQIAVVPYAPVPQPPARSGP